MHPEHSINIVIFIIIIIYEYRHHANSGCLKVGELNIVPSIKGNLLGICDDPAQ